MLQAEMLCVKVVMMAVKHIHMGPSSSWNAQLHLVVEEAIMLLPVALVRV